MNRRNLLKLLFGGSVAPTITLLPEGKIYRSLHSLHTYDAGLFYCPYVPLQINGKIGVGTITPNTQLRISKND